MNKKSILTIMLSSIMLTACTPSAKLAESLNANAQTTSNTISLASNIDTTNMFTARDLEIGYDETTSVAIKLSDTNAEFDSDKVSLENGILTINSEGVYILSGQFSGMIKVDVEYTEKVQLVLNGVEINNSTLAAIYVKQADKVFITTAQGTENILSSAEQYTQIDENNIDSTIFSKSDLTINGSGKLTINSVAGHGIVSKDDLVIGSGELIVNAKNQGISANNSIRIASGKIDITSEKDGIKAEHKDTEKGFIYIADGNITIKSQQDGISGSGYVLIEDGEFNINSGEGYENGTTHTEEMPAGEGFGRNGEQMIPNQMPNNKFGTAPKQIEPPIKTEIDGSQKQNIQIQEQQIQEQQSTDTTTQTTEDSEVSKKGIKSGTQLIIQGGEMIIDSADDGIHTNGNMEINNGTLNISSGDDGIHADGSFIITAGKIDIKESYEGIEAKTIDIAGGQINIISQDDGLNATDALESTNNPMAVSEGVYIKISDGKLTIDAQGDGIDSNGSLEITGGETYVTGPSNNGNGFLDYMGDGKINGGIFVAVGSSGMAQNFKEATQGTFMTNLKGEKNSTLIIKDSSGNEILRYEVSKDYDTVLVSSPQIQQGSKYNISNGTSETEIEMTSILIGETNQMGPMQRKIQN